MAMAAFMCFLLFGMLGAVYLSLNKSVAGDESGRYMTVNRINVTQPMPLRYAEDIARKDGVDNVSVGVWFGGYVDEPGRQFPTFPVRAESHLNLFPELEVAPDARDRWLADRRGALVERQLAEENGWDPGDQIVINSLIWPQKDGSKAWPLIVSGVYTDNSPFGARTLLLHFDFFDEARAFGAGSVDWIVFDVTAGANADALASSIDAANLNSASATRTQSEETYQQAYLNQFGNVTTVIITVAAAGFLTSLLVLANTQALSVSARSKDFAILRVIGYSRAAIVGSILIGAAIILGAGAVLGLLAAWLYMSFNPINLGSFLPEVGFHPDLLVIAAPILLVIILVSSYAPIMSAYSSRPVEGLR